MWNRKHPIAPGFDQRLKVALDRITPPSVVPRYAMAHRAFKPWRLAPIALAGSATVLLALSATAATGSANPVVWSQRAASTIQSVTHPPEPSPSPATSSESSPNTSRSAGAPAKPAAPPKAAPKPAPPAQHADESPQPTPSDDNSGPGSHHSSPKPSPPPDEH